VYLGLVGPTLAPGLDDPEQLVPTLARQYLGPVVGVLFAGALVSIILSTVDSTLLAAGGFISHNVLSPMFPGWTSRDRLHAARATVFVLGVVATMLALGADSIYGLVLTASAFGGAGVFVVSCFAVFSTRGGSASAYAGLVVGLVVWAWGEYAAGWTAPFVTAVVASTVAYVVLALGKRAGDTSMKVA
jgi:Na+/proline symporter